MRRDRLLVLALLLLLAGGAAVPVVAVAAEAAEGCAGECPADDGCGDEDLRCGCCAGVVPAVVPLTLAVSGSRPLPAPSVTAPAVPAPTVVQRPFHPPRAS